MDRLQIKSDPYEIPVAVDFIQKSLERRKVSRRDKLRAMIAAEEVLAKLIECASPDTPITVEATSGLGGVALRMTAAGEPFDIGEIGGRLYFNEQPDQGEEANDVIRQMLKKLLGDSLECQNRQGVNRATLRVKKSPYAALIYTLIALVLGLAVGLLIKAALPDAAKAVSDNLFTPVYTVFMNALKMIVGPLVFCSVASSIADFGNLKALGRIAARVVSLYLITSMLAIGIGLLTYRLFPIGRAELASAVTDAASATIAKGEGVTISLRDTLVGIVPTDIITPFQKSDMLQLIFMATILGMAAAILAPTKPGLRKALDTLNAAFSLITGKLVAFIPLVVFCSMAKMMIAMNLSSLADVLAWVPVIYAGDVLMIGVYLLLLALLARVNPLKFLSKYYPAMVAAFTFASSNAALPSSVKQCDEMGVSSRVYSFSLPLGATINMDGSCISLIVSALFMARIFGIPVTGGVLLSLFIAIMVLSVGSPGVPGGNLVCLALLIPQIGVPAEAISLVMGLYPLVGMMQTCANVTGDAVVTTIVAKHEGLLDEKKYNA